MLNTSSYILPSSVDLRPGMDNVPDVKDQGNIGSCLAHACATMYDVIMDRNSQGNAGRDFDPSRLYLYYWFRNFEARLDGAGGYLKDAFEVLENKGVCPESEWPYIVTKENDQPPVSCDKSAQRWKIGEYQDLMPSPVAQRRLAIEQSINNVKHAVASGRPVVLGLIVSKSFVALRENKDWRTHSYDPKTDGLGGHATTCIGYDDAAQRFLVQNSWGPNWGDGGFFGVPYSMFGDWMAVQSAYTVIQYPQGVFPVAAPGYVKKSYDAARKNAIVQYVKGQIDPIVQAANEYNVSADEIEQALGWKSGTWDIVKKVA
jgi:C1A family cysteine protease